MGKGATKMDFVDDAVRIVVEQRMIENPLTTDGLVDAALSAGEDGPRWTPAAVNLVTMIGGLARIKGLSDVQKAAAGRYRSLFERAQIGGAQATDYSAVKVDVSGSGRDIVEDGAQARREYLIARRRLGPFQASLLERVICMDVSVREMARSMGEGNGGRGMQRTRRRLLEAVDDLVQHFAQGSRRRVLKGGAVAADWTLPVDGAEPEKAH
jgi:hypothetical protein